VLFEPDGKVQVTIEPDAGHLSMMSHPGDVADLILADAGQGKQR